jgi:hypothetical protein
LLAVYNLLNLAAHFIRLKLEKVDEEMVRAFSNEGKRPLKSIYEVWKGHWMLHLGVSLDAHYSLRYLCDGSFITMSLSIIWR